jgi:hypothetical protein
MKIDEFYDKSFKNMKNDEKRKSLICMKEWKYKLIKFIFKGQLIIFRDVIIHKKDICYCRINQIHIQ